MQYGNSAITCAYCICNHNTCVFVIICRRHNTCTVYIYLYQIQSNDNWNMYRSCVYLNDLLWSSQTYNIKKWKRSLFMCLVILAYLDNQENVCSHISLFTEWQNKNKVYRKSKVLIEKKKNVLLSWLGVYLGHSVHDTNDLCVHGNAYDQQHNSFLIVVLL